MKKILGGTNDGHFDICCLTWSFLKPFKRHLSLDNTCLIISFVLYVTSCFLCHYELCIEECLKYLGLPLLESTNFGIRVSCSVIVKIRCFIKSTYISA